MSRKTFGWLCQILQPMEIFQSRGKRPQWPVQFQLTCFLTCYAQQGSDSLRVAQQLSLGHGTVFLYCHRVTHAFHELGLNHSIWPDKERKHKIADVFEAHSGLGCIGVCDGSLIRLTKDPWMSKGVYQCCKKFPAINVQATVDHEKRFTSFDLGWPGSIPDVTIFKVSYIWNNCAVHFAPGEYILADKVWPFNEPEIHKCLKIEQMHQHDFNKRLSHVWIWIEHAFGWLKGRFPALKAMGSANNIQEVHKAVEALMVVHNLCIDMDDHPEDILDFNPNDPQGSHEDEDLGDNDGGARPIPQLGATVHHRIQIPGQESEAWLRMKGLQKCLQLLNELCPCTDYI
ncbi:hypothetical protein K439DRAFT_1359267 [Ramaria rubella]|nr:hypothetical protein K439DRAFT_1359267 [Ramaria rubella]